MQADALAAVVVSAFKVALAPLLARVAVLEGADLTKEITTMRERLAVLETRAPVPGPPGGRGKDGIDGLGYDDLAIEQVDETTVTLKAIRGDHAKVIGSVTFPVARFTGDYEGGRAYTPGQLVRTKSAIWHCRVATTLAPDTVTYDASGKPAGPQGKDYWTLVLSERRR